jgi:putative MATE family efflux protein
MQKEHFVKAVWLKKRESVKVSDRTIFNIAVPIILSTATGTLLNLVDTIMVGQYGANQLAAVGMAGTALGIFGVFAGALSVGMTASIARSLGEKDNKKAGKLAWTGITFGFAFGIFLTFIWTFLNTPVLKFLGAKGELLTQAELYLGIVKYTLAFGILNGMWNSMLNANSYTKPLVLYTVIVNIVHLAGNFLLIYGNFGFPKWGVKGAAVSSVIATAVGFIFASVIAQRSRERLKLNFTPRLKEEAKLFPQMVNLALPTLIEWGIWTAGIFFVNKFIAAYGAKQIAVYQIGMKIQGFFMLALSGFMTASITLVGRSFGARNAYYIYAWNKRILTYALLITSVGTVLCILFPYGVMRVFMNAKEDRKSVV